MTKRAKIIEDHVFNKLLMRVSDQPEGTRNKVMLLLSHRAGLRAAEISGLTWGDVLNAEGDVNPTILSIPPRIAKKGSGRDVPMHPDLYKALVEFRKERGKVKANDRLMYAIKTPHMSPNYVAVFIRNLYTEWGLIGCSSHSGRRTFITKTARMANSYGCSLKDVQRLAGHKYIDTTEKYIDPSDKLHDLVRAV